jgi:hypothetical protein
MTCPDSRRTSASPAESLRAVSRPCGRLRRHHSAAAVAAAAEKTPLSPSTARWSGTTPHETEGAASWKVAANAHGLVTRQFRWTATARCLRANLVGASASFAPRTDGTCTLTAGTISRGCGKVILAHEFPALRSAGSHRARAFTGWVGFPPHLSKSLWKSRSKDAYEEPKMVVFADLHQLCTTRNGAFWGHRSRCLR